MCSEGSVGGSGEECPGFSSELLSKVLCSRSAKKLLGVIGRYDRWSETQAGVCVYERRAFVEEEGVGGLFCVKQSREFGEIDVG